MNANRRSAVPCWTSVQDMGRIAATDCPAVNDGVPQADGWMHGRAVLGGGRWAVGGGRGARTAGGRRRAAGGGRLEYEPRHSARCRLAPYAAYRLPPTARGRPPAVHCALPNLT